jgi:HK97 family phage major capsid protein
MTLLELQKKRHDAKQLGAKILAEASVDGRSADTLWQSERKAFEAAASEVKALTAQIDAIEASEGGRRVLSVKAPENGWGGADTTTGRATWTDSNGNILASAGPGESYAAALRATAERRGKPWAEFRSGSLGRVVRAMVTGNRAGLDDVEIGALSESVNSAGGYMVPTALAGYAIDLARPMSVIYKAGAQTVEMPTESLTIATLATDPTFTVVAENAAIPESSPTFASVNLFAKKLATYVKCSRELLEDATNAAGLLESAMARALAVELDRQVLMGTSGSEFNGLNTRSEIAEQSSVGSPTYDDFASAWTTLMEANAPDDNLSYIVCPRDATTLALLTGGTTQTYIEPPSVVAGMRRLVSSSITRTQGGGGNESSAFVLDGRELLIGARSGGPLIEITSEADDAFAKHQTWIKCTWRVDFAITRPSFIVRLAGITA